MISTAHSYSQLQRSLLDSYFFPRKQENQLCLLIDASSLLVYPVPVAIEHIDFLDVILRRTSSQRKLSRVKDQHSLALHLVPSNLLFSPSLDAVVSVVTGVSGAESGYGVRHTFSQLHQAHDHVFSFVNEGEIPFLFPLQEDTLVTRYCVDDVSAL